jgi:hypothetical protein
MWKLCKYKNALGIPGKGIHSYRICNLAIVDIIFTLLGARILQILIFPENHYLLILTALFLLSIVLHRMFCVKTTIDKLLFG